MKNSLRNLNQVLLDPLRLRLAKPDALIPMAFLGLISGILASMLVTAFRLVLESLQIYFLGLPAPGEYSALPLEWRFLLPAIGGLLLGLVFHFLPKGLRLVGVGYTIIRFHRHEANLPWPNAIVQFVSATFALLVGMSSGREGPGIHLGATGGSWLGRLLDLPHNSVRTLVGCGAAAAIAASFNTPLAAVIFALEIIVRQYTLATFIPIMLAASAGALFSTLFFGTNPAFDIQLMHNLALWEVPILIGMGLLIGVFAAGFIRITDESLRRTWDWPVWVRFAAIGVLTGLIGLGLPQVMGISYDSVGLAAGAQFTLGCLILLVAAKLILSALTFGFGLPLGPIGSTIVVGGFTGSAVGMGLLNVTQIPLSDVAFYTVLGMGAMMGATLQAPLAALAAVIELTGDTGAITPALITIIVASLTSRAIFKQEGIYDTVLRTNAHQMRGLSLWHNANDIAISSIFERRFAEIKTQSSPNELAQAMTTHPVWLVVLNDARVPIAALPAFDVDRFLAAYTPANTEPPTADEAPELHFPADQPFDLATQFTLQPARTVDIGLTLSEARELMQADRVDVLIGLRATLSPFKRVFGVLTSQQLEDHTQNAR